MNKKSTKIRLDDDQLRQIEKIIGYTFKDKELLRQCFTLSSASSKNNERLEFLGDSIIELFVSEILYLRSGEDEGDMTELRKKFVANDVLREATERLGLEKYLCYIGKKENLGKKPIASLFEALAAGVYLDGGMRVAKKFIVEKLIKVEADKIFKQKLATGNYKTVLQEYLQGRGVPRAEYKLVEKTGPDHNPTFLISASAQGLTATGRGSSKTAAEAAAAKNLIEMLRNG